jgi:tyrosine-protein phosphatase OCA1
MVEEDLYRSGMPHELNFPFLEKLHIKTVIYLGSEEPSLKFLQFMDDQEIRFYHLSSGGSLGGGTSGGNNAFGKLKPM